MASAQLSSPPRAGAGSDLRGTAPAGRGVLLGEQQHTGLRALAAAGHFSGHRPRPGWWVPPCSGCTPAQAASLRAVPLWSSPSSPALPPSPNSLPREGGWSVPARHGFPHRTSLVQVPHSWLVPGLESGSPAGSGQVELLGSRAGGGPRHPRHPWAPLPAGSRAPEPASVLLASNV